MTTFQTRAAPRLAMLWRIAVLALLVWNALETREARRASEAASTSAEQALQAVDDLARLIDDALGDDNDEDTVEQGT